MNYLAHAYRFLDSPLMVAGTALPDWLSVVDRKVRLRTRRVVPMLDQLDEQDRQVADGVLQHLRDDDAFHNCPAFVMLEAELSVRFRRVIPDPYDHRPPFLGHIVTELLLDAWLTEQCPEWLDRYYQILDDVCPNGLQRVVNRLASRETDRLASFVTQFLAARVLYDYQDDQRLLTRLNQVLRRVTLPPLDEQCLSVLRDARTIVWRHAEEMLAAVEAVEGIPQV
ncbi:MAG: hypothetical protein U0996_13510 [Planctomycetaceae bacterium]